MSLHSTTSSAGSPGRISSYLWEWYRGWGAVRGIRCSSKRPLHISEVPDPGDSSPTNSRRGRAQPSSTPQAMPGAALQAHTLLSCGPHLLS